MFELVKNFGLVMKVGKIVKELKAVYAENSETADKIKEIIDDLIAILNKVKAIIPGIDDLVESIIAVIKKYFGKKEAKK